LRMASSAARNLADRLDTEVAMVAKKTRRLAQIFEFCVRTELAVESSTKMVGIWLELWSWAKQNLLPRLGA
jgi:hypothetical protein